MDPFTDAAIVAMELGEAVATEAPLIGRTIAQAATALERAGPAVVAAGVATAAYAVKRPFGIFSGPETPGKAGKKLRRLIHEGFEPKKLFKDLGKSLLPAHKRFRDKHNLSITVPGEMPGRAAKRPGRAGKKGKKNPYGKFVKKLSDGRRLYQFGVKPALKPKGKKPKAKSKKKSGVKKNVSVKYETHGLIQRDDVSYFGFQSTGGLDELFEIACEGVFRALLRKFRIQVRNHDEPLYIAQSVPAVDKFKIWSRKRDYSTGTDGGDQADTVDLTPSSANSYKEVVAGFATAMRARANTGYFPYYMIAYNNGGTASANEVMRDTKFGQAKVALSNKMKIKMRNITPNDGDGTDRFALDTNPLQGRLYKFAGDVPRTRESVYDSQATLFAKFHDRQAPAGLCFGPQRADAGDHGGDPAACAAIMGEDKLMSSPPANGKVIFSNCVSSHPVTFAPGASQTHNMKFTFNGTFVKFLQKYNTNQFTLPNIGTTHWLGLEQAYKQKKKAASGQHAADGHDHVCIEYDMDTTMSGGAAFAAAERAPREVVTRAALNSAPTS